VRKGELTRETIVSLAAAMASRVGLSGLSIGSLADALKISKSGLFAHFGSKERLTADVVTFAGERFVATVLQPALRAARGEPQLREIFERWLGWPEASGLPGGCFFVAAATELDDRPGQARDKLVELQRAWFETLAHLVQRAGKEGHFRADVDADQFAQDLYGIMLGCHHATRLLHDRMAVTRARRAFEALIGAARPTPHRS
jgi:AcrR family transcriptional regulator